MTKINFRFLLPLFLAAGLMLTNLTSFSADRSKQNSTSNDKTAKEIEALVIDLKNVDSQVRLQAVKNLSKKGKTAVPALLEALNDEDLLVKRVIIRTLGKLKDPRAVQTLIKQLNDINPRIRYDVIEALGQIGDGRALSPLIKTLKDRNKRVGRKAAETLDKLVDLNVLKPLMQALQSGKWETRKDAVTALSKIGALAIDPLTRAMADENEEVRAQAILGIKQIKPPPTEAMVQALSSYNPRIRERAAIILGDFGDVAAVPPLSQSFNDTVSLVQRAVTDALVKIGSPSVEPLIQKLKDNNGLVRKRAVIALGRIGDERVKESLVQILNDNNENVRKNAVAILEQLGWQPQTAPEKISYLMAKEEWEELGKLGPQVVKPFLKRIQDEDEQVRYDIAAILGKIGSPLAVEVLINALKDINGRVRSEAAEALGRIADTRAIEPLIQALNDDLIEVRLGVIRGLAMIGLPAVPPLIQALNDPDKSRQAGAAKALGEIGDNRAVEPSFTLIMKSYGKTRSEATMALSKMGPKGIERLIELLVNKNSSIRKNAAEALAQAGWESKEADLVVNYLSALQEWEKLVIMGSSASEQLISLLEDQDEIVRSNAAFSLGEIKDPRGIGPLIVLLADDDMGVRHNAAAALVMIGTPAEASLIITLRDSRSGVRMQAALILDKIGWLPKKGALTIAEEEVRISYFIAKQKWKDLIGMKEDIITVTVKEVLVKFINDDDYLVRKGIANALTALGFKPLNEKERIQYLIAGQTWSELVNEGTAAIPALVRLLDDQEVTMRKKAVEVLGWVGDEKAFPPLVQALQDWQASYTAVEALENLGWLPTTDEEKVHFLAAKNEREKLLDIWPMTKDILLRDLQSNNHKHVSSAVKTLIALGNEEIIPDIVDLLHVKGTGTMANEFFNSGNPELKSAAMDWGEVNGKPVKLGYTTIKWQMWSN